MSRIQAQAAKLWEIIRAPETFAKYKSAVVVTWDILREIFLLLWLSFLWVAVLADSSVSLGRSARTWVENQKHPNSDRSASEVGKALLSASSKSLASAISQAKRQLGIPVVLEAASEPTVPTAAIEPAATATKPESTVLATEVEPAVTEKGGDQSKQPAKVS